MEIIPAWIRRIWNADELRVLVLLSLGFQIFLIFFAVCRKYSASRTVSLALWLFYLLADYVATLALGSLLNKLNNNGNNSSNLDVLAFWSPFLLLHLGGPDAITAYSMEDNELWWRHFLGLIFQVSVSIVVFLLSWPSTRLWKAAILVYIAGILKYAERTWSLSAASQQRLMDSMLTAPESGPDYAKFMEEYVSQKEGGLEAEIHMEPDPHSKFLSVSDFEPVRITEKEIMSNAYKFFKTFKRLVVDLIVTSHDGVESKSFFMKRFPDQAFKVIEIELSFVFDVLYTKAAFVHTSKGRVARATSLCMIILSLLFFIHSSKGGYKEVDIIITYVLLLVAVCLETISILLLFVSDWTFIWLSDTKLSVIKKICEFFCKLHLLVKSRWSNQMSQYSLISFCLRDQPTIIRKILDCLNLKDNWDYLRYTKRIVASDELKELIFNELKEKAESVEKSAGSNKRYDTCRGEWTLQNSGFRKILGWSIDEAEFDESILLWHIATDLCYYGENSSGDCRKDQRNRDRKELSRDISNYMMYLLVQRPLMLTVGIEKNRYGDTCAEARKFFQKERENIYMKYDKQRESKMDKNEVQAWRACESILKVATEVPPIDVKGDKSKSVLFNACRLAKSLLCDSVTIENRWRVVSGVWMEMLCFAAIHCRGNIHAKQLSSGGGEFLTHVWFLITHLGMGEHYLMETGHARAKLIVEK